MAFDVTASMQAMESLFQESGYFPSVVIGEPKDPPPDMTVALMMDNIDVAEATLTTGVLNHVVMSRIYGGRNIFDPMENLELGLARAVSKALDLLAGSFTLGGTIRALDWAGEEGMKVSVKFGHVDVGGTMMRIADMFIPLIVDDSVTFVP